MRLLVLLSWTFVLILGQNELDLSTLFAAGLFPTSECSNPCLSDLVQVARKLFFFKDSVRNFEQLCATYENASLCVAEKEVACEHKTSFGVNSDAVFAACKAKGINLKPLIPCLEKNIDVVLNECDSTCLFTSSLSELSRRESMRRLAKEASKDTNIEFLLQLTPMCAPTSCFISCASKGIDKKCSPAGQEMVTALLRPFTLDAELLAKDKELTSSILSVAPPSCHPFLLLDGINAMIHGNLTVKGGKEETEMFLLHQKKDEEEEKEKDSSDLSSLTSAAGVSECGNACLSDLLIAAGKVLRFNDTISHFESLCSTYDNASLCVAREEISCIHESSWVVGTSGIDEICKSKKKEFSRHLSCLSPIVDSSLNHCDSYCHFTDGLDSLLSSSIVEVTQNGDDRAALYQELAPVCPTVGCMLSCVSRSLNKDCQPAGTEIVETLLRPFTTLSEMLIRMGPQAVDEVRATLPTSCTTFISLTDLSDIAAGRENKRWASPFQSDVSVKEGKSGIKEGIRGARHCTKTTVSSMKDGNDSSC